MTYPTFPPAPQIRKPAPSVSKSPTSTPIRLLASDIDGTLLNPQFRISPDDLAALGRAHATGIEIVLDTGRRHTFGGWLTFDFFSTLARYRLPRRQNRGQTELTLSLSEQFPQSL